jgi:hypothetical protein
MTYGYYQLCEAIQTAATNASYINTTTWGNIFDVDMRKMTLFPLCHVLIGQAEVQERTVIYDVDILVMDVVDYSKQDPNVDPYSYEGVAMKQDIYHRALFSAQEMIASMRRGVLYTDGFRLVNDPVCEPIDEDFENTLCGWKLTLQIETPNPTIIC